MAQINGSDTMFWTSPRNPLSDRLGLLFINNSKREVTGSKEKHYQSHKAITEAFLKVFHIDPFCKHVHKSGLPTYQQVKTTAAHKTNEMVVAMAPAAVMSDCIV